MERYQFEIGDFDNEDALVEYIESANGCGEDFRLCYYLIVVNFL